MYKIDFSCGHTDLIDINGTANQIQARINFLTEKETYPIQVYPI